MEQSKSVKINEFVDGRLLDHVWRSTNENMTRPQRDELNKWRVLLLMLTSNALFHVSQERQPKAFDALVKLKEIIADIPIFNEP